MTRETKVGLVVATTFLCLVSLVIASKLRGPEADGAAVADARQIEPGRHDPARGDGFEPSEEPNPGKPIAPVPSPALPKGPPSLTIPTKPPADPLPRAMPQPLAPAPTAPAIGLPGPVVELPTINPALPAPAPTSRGWWGRYTQPSEVPVSAPIANVKANQGATQVEGDGSQSVVKVAQVEDPIKLPPVSPTVPAPIGDPVVPIPTPTPIEPKQKDTAKPPLPAPAPTADPAPGAPKPIVLPAPPGLDEPKQEPAIAPPLPTQIPTPGIPAGPLGGPVAPAPVEPKQMPLADPLLPAAPKEPTTTLPSGPAAPHVGTTAPPKHIGTIGIAGNDASVTPPVAAALPHATVPALPAAGTDLPKVIGHSDAVHRIEPGQTTFAQLSQRWYGSDKYAQALLQYNRQHLLNRANTDIQHDPPVLQANQPIYYPGTDLLGSTFAALIKAPAAPTANSSGPPVVNISPPTPLAAASAGNGPATTATVSYRVPQTEHIMPIAQRTLGSRDAWTEISLLNPAVRTDLPIPAGTLLRLPARARAD